MIPRFYPSTREPVMSQRKRSTADILRATPTHVYTFINGNLPPEQLELMAIFLLNNEELTRAVLGLPTGDQARFVHRVDQVRRGRWLFSTSFLITPTKTLPSIDAETAKAVASLGTVCSATGHLPSSAVLSAGFERLGDTPTTSTGLMNVWRGEHGHQRVSIIAFRSYPAQSLEDAKEVRVIYPRKNALRTGRILQILWKQVPMWMRLSHPNVLPFRGVNMTLFQLALVYDWGENGNIIEYAASHPDASRIALVRVTIFTTESKNGH